MICIFNALEFTISLLRPSWLKNLSVFPSLPLRLQIYALKPDLFLISHVYICVCTYVYVVCMLYACSNTCMAHCGSMCSWKPKIDVEGIILHCSPTLFIDGQPLSKPELTDKCNLTSQCILRIPCPLLQWLVLQVGHYTQAALTWILWSKLMSSSLNFKNFNHSASPSYLPRVSYTRLRCSCLQVNTLPTEISP